MVPGVSPQEGYLRVYCIVNPPDVPFYHDVKSVDEAKAVINREADIQLKDPAVVANVFGLQVYRVYADDAKSWEDWEDEDGYTIDDHMSADDDDAVAVPE